jgi:FkbM family methyltransferase
MKSFQFFVWLVRSSVKLDIGLLTGRVLDLYSTLVFLTVKYFLIVKHIFLPYQIGVSSVKLLGWEIYYENRYGLAGLQRILVSHGEMIRRSIADEGGVATIVDVGANVGHFTRLSKLLFPYSTVYSIEPVPIVFECLKRNVKEFENVHIYNMAISDVSGTLSMAIDMINPALCAVSDDGVMVVPCTTLNTFCEENNISTIDLLKIDVESHELEVLRGADQKLKNIHWLWLEITLKHNDYTDNENYTISELMSRLYGDGYNFQLVAYRNFADKSEGELPALDALFVNKLYRTN